jgi:lactoylglutathione lyase
MTESPADRVRMSHVAIAVADFDVSSRFYTEGLGFEANPMVFESGDEVAAVSEVEPPVRMRSRYFEKDGTRIELMAWETPPVHGDASQQRNQRGLTHLSFEVDDIGATEARLIALGGVALPDARVYLEPVKIALVFLTDPDGTRIELLQRNAEPPA